MIVPCKYRTIALALLLSLWLTACAHPPAKPSSGGPPGSSGFYESMMGIYSGPLNHLNGVRRGSCPMHPSDSQYSRQAMARFGLLKGWIMTMDRLMRCGRDEIELAPKVFARGAWKAYDPIERNDWSRYREEPAPQGPP